MTELHAEPAEPVGIAEIIADTTEFEPVEAPATAVAPVLITEQEVRLATAAAIPVRPAKRAHWWAVAFSRASAPSRARPRPAPRYYAKRTPLWYENALMSREMDRL